MQKARRGRIFLFALFAVSLRVLTGAPEAQVNFTSLLSEGSIANQNVIFNAPITEHAAIFNSEKADSIPEKHRTYTTYKKYTTPDKSLSLTLDTGEDNQIFQILDTTYSASSYTHDVTDLRSNSPPKFLNASLNSLTVTTHLNNSWEKKIGTSTIDNGTWGVRSL